MVNIERDHTDVGQRIENTRSNCVIYEKKETNNNFQGKW